MKVDMDLLRQELERDEGKKKLLYKDTKGKWTIGIGHNIQDRGLSDAAIAFIFEEDMRDHMAELERALPWVSSLPEPAQRVLANMAFNMGVPTLLTFKNTLGAFQAHSWEKAAEGMEASLWAHQVGARADRLIAVIRGLSYGGPKEVPKEAPRTTVSSEAALHAVKPAIDPTHPDWKKKLWDLLQHSSQS